MNQEKNGSDRLVQPSKSANLVNFEEFTAFLIENGPLDPDQLRLLSVLANLEAINRT